MENIGGGKEFLADHSQQLDLEFNAASSSSLVSFGLIVFTVYNHSVYLDRR